MIYVQKNDYVTPTEVRDEVVQGICEAFLRGGWDSVFHPVSDGLCRGKTLYIARNSNDTKFYGFTSRRYDGEEIVKFNGAEMEKAFQVLIDNGYFMWRIYQYGSWMGYECTKTPVAPRNGAVRVAMFRDVID